MNPDDFKDVFNIWKLKNESKYIKDIDDYHSVIYDSEKRKGEIIEALMKAVEGMKEKPIEKAREYDVSSTLPDDALAKLNLLHGDCVVIPIDKLEELFDKVRNL